MPKFRLPFLIVHGEADVLCNIEGSRYGRLSGCYPGGVG